MKKFVFTSIATILLVSAAVSYFFEREKEEPDDYIYYIPSSEQVAEEPELTADDADDGFHGRLYVKDDYWLGVDLEGEGSSDDTKALKPFQKYGGLIFKGSMSFEFDPDYFGGCDWQITLSVYPWNKKFGTIELPWGSITIRDATDAFIQFGSYTNSDPNLFHRYYELNNGECDYFLKDFLYQISKPYENSFGISYIISIVRNTDKKVAFISGEF